MLSLAKRQMIEVSISSLTPHIFHKEEDLEIYIIGRLQDYSGNSAISRIKNLFIEAGKLKDFSAVISNLDNLRGNFSLIIKDSDNKVFACVDRIKSFPLVYRYDNQGLLITNDIGKDKYNFDLRKDEIAFLEFKMTGYVTGKDTLFSDIYQLQAAEALYFDGQNRPVTKSYFLFFNRESVDGKKEKIMERLHEINLKIFKKLIERLDGRTVYVALSAGLDSRFVLCMLKSLGYKQLKAFSYGIPDNWDARGAKAAAQRLGVPWFFLPYNRKSAREIFFSEDGKRYFQFSHLLSVTPFFQDFYALHYLKRERKLSSDIVIINGQTGDFITGDHVPEAFNRRGTVSKDDLLDAIIKKHYSLWSHLHTDSNLDAMRKRILSVLPFYPEDTLDREYAMKLYELWEWRERQCKYVVNGQRSYDFFGLAWELPLWDDEYLYFWSSLPFKFKFKQDLYKEYLSKFDFFGLFKNHNYRRYNSPRYVEFLKYLFIFTGRKRFEYRKVFLSYWQNNSYLYAIYPYFEYLKDARFHRHAISYLVKYLLEKEYRESIQA
jgi:asparagine synthase (glutamine-hydrolysing)